MTSVENEEHLTRVDEVCEFQPVVGKEKLEMCWCDKKCLLGKGGFSFVYKGKWKENLKKTQTSIDVAVKDLFNPYLHIDYEIKTFDKVKGDSNILLFYEEIKIRNPPRRLIVTELCDGTLRDLVVVNKDSLKLTSFQLKNVVLRQITVGMNHLHRKGILHRDLKPHNILYRIITPSDDNPSDEVNASDGIVMKVADFGGSRSVKEGADHYTRSVTGTVYSQQLRPFGTDGWLAPEVLKDEAQLEPFHAVDIYPLGLIFAFTLCGGKHPYGEVDAKTRNFRIQNKEPILDKIKQSLIKEHGDKCYDLINRMLDPSPGGRPTAAEILEHDCFDHRPTTRDIIDSKKENELLRLCRLERLDNDNLTLFTQLVNDKDAVNVNCTEAGYDFTPLILLCRYNQSDSLCYCLKILFQQRPDIDVNQTDNLGINALIHLCRCSFSDNIVEVAQLLIAQGIDVNMTIEEVGMNALMNLCVYSSNKKIVEMAQLLIDKGINVNQTDEKGRNALMHLCRWSTCYPKIVEMAKLLIDNRIDLEQTDNKGRNVADYLKSLRSSFITDFYKSAILELLQQQD